MKTVIKFIMDKQLASVDQLPTLIVPISENFDISSHDGKLIGLEAVKAMMDEIVHWENHPEIYESLEKILSDKFYLITPANNSRAIFNEDGKSNG